MRRVKRNELILNQPLPWSVYDDQGRLLLRAGYVLSIPHHIDLLIERGVMTKIVRDEGGSASRMLISTEPVAPEVAVAEPVFARAGTLALTLKRMHAHLLSNTLQQPLEWMVLGLASELARACTDDADAFLAALHLDRQSPYLVVQQLLGATLVELSARVLGLDEGARLTLCCAALTRDLALLPMQAQLDKQTTGLSAEQQAQVRAHPERTVAWLQQLGVTDPRWLRLVRQHHERSDGSGYPQALAGVSIPEGARLIALADSYAAMVTPRQNRGGQYPHTALKSLFLDGERLYNATLASSLVKILSMTPPGSLVRLANGELAVVRSRPSADGQNDIWSLYGRDGMPFLLALRRNTDNPDHKIIGYVRVEDCRSAAPVLNRLWLNSIERSKA